MSNKTKNKKPEKDEGFFGILFFLSTFYVSIIVGSYSFLRDLNSSTNLGWQAGLPATIMGMVLLGIVLVVGFYLIIVILIGIAELKSYYINLNPNQIKVRNKLREMVLSTPSEIISIGLSLAIFLILVLLVYFNMWFAIIASFVYMIAFIFFALSRKTRKEVISTMAIGIPKATCKTYILLILAGLLVLSVFYVAFGAITFNFAKFEIHQDKEIYTANESVYITIYSMGIIKPIASSVTYSNTKEKLEYIRNSEFPGAPIYIKIPSENLTNPPYNSYIEINYDIPNTKLLLLRKNLTQSELIPVIKS